MKIPGINSSLSQIPKKPLPFSHPGLLYGFSNRQNGNMSLCYGDTARSLNNRRDFLQGLNIDYRDLVCAEQVHGNRVKYVLEEDRGRGALTYKDSIADTDAFITDKRGLPLAIFTADCLCVFLYDSKSGAIGLAHAGYKSSKGKITLRTVELMRKEFNTLPQNLHLVFGPSIRSCCYEVGSDFDAFFPGNLIKRNERYYLDLSGINKMQALESGVKEGNIFDSGICTSCQNKEFFSYRKEGESCGRMLSVAMLR